VSQGLLAPHEKRTDRVDELHRRPRLDRLTASPLRDGLDPKRLRLRVEVRDLGGPGYPRRCRHALESGGRRLLTARPGLRQDDPGVGVLQRDRRRLQRQAGARRPQRRHRIGELPQGGPVVVELAIGQDR